MDVIQKVDGPTKWMNPLVTVENPMETFECVSI